MPRRRKPQRGARRDIMPIDDADVDTSEEASDSLLRRCHVLCSARRLVSCRLCDPPTHCVSLVRECSDWGLA